MSYRTNTDNIYPENTMITAKANPLLRLSIRKYYQRIYYCTVIDSPGTKELAYFERELIQPTNTAGQKS
ncbi:hypothetical protein [Chryseosolibacter indicus]|uniref:Uncharacterized protein n=1 Tax=Chryseosolibacter indicus TaxID=2782351 RepID=A0ABS5W049_9BACT|nr:hypothetical protein [Chryseosolibacter indicus]MBT1706354.1 hypothetical protein [Chryseosolibacter indicus]